jgi:O-antigen/teichoic acid export membrane protein
VTEAERVAHLRGSVLLLAGRVLSLLCGFGVQVLLVRFLSKSDYGGFAYGLSLVALLQAVLALGLDRADVRFLALYDERHDYGRLVGVLIVEAVTITLLGGAVVAVALGVPEVIHVLTNGHGSYAVIGVLLLLAPVQALDTLVVNLFAVFGRPGAVFVRRYVLEPLLKLAVVGVLVVADRGPRFLAGGYVVVSAAGFLLYAVLSARLLRETGVLAALARARVRLPVRELFGFAWPMLLTGLVTSATFELASLVLGRTHSTVDVASFRAVVPLAMLNLTVSYSFLTLFTPYASRLHVRGEQESLRDLYWQSASWVALLTFPVFATQVALARPLTVALFGARYASSSHYLVLLAVGTYVGAALGFNGMTLQILGRRRFLVGSSVAVLAVIVAMCLFLVPVAGALGAAVTALVTLLVHNVVKQFGLRGAGGVGLVDLEHLRCYASIAAATIALWGLARLTHPPLVVGIAAVALVWLGLLVGSRRLLRLHSTFPAVARLRLIRQSPAS